MGSLPPGSLVANCQSANSQFTKPRPQFSYSTGLQNGVDLMSRGSDDDVELRARVHALEMHEIDWIIRGHFTRTCGIKLAREKSAAARLN